MQWKGIVPHRIEDIVARNRTMMTYAWRGASSLVVDNEGSTGELRIGGFYFRQTRYLSRVRFRIDGASPQLCSAAQVAPNELEFAYVFPPVSAEMQGSHGGGSGSGGMPSSFGIATRSLDLRLTYRVHHGACEIDLAITNRWNDEARFSIEWELDADYAAVAEVLGDRMQSANVESAADGRNLIFRYEHAELPYRTTITAVDAIDWKIGDRRLTAHVTAARFECITASIHVVANDFEDPIADHDRFERELRVQRWLDSAASLSSSSEPPIISITNRAVRDLGSLALLEGRSDEWLYPGAGVPLFLNAWGR